MVESLLSFSQLVLFGHNIVELKIVNPFDNPTNVMANTSRHYARLGNHPIVNGHTLAVNDLILVWKQKRPDENGIYKVVNNITSLWEKQKSDQNTIYFSPGIDKYKGFYIKLEDGFQYLGESTPGAVNRGGTNRFLERQISGASFARIYGFSFEGTYYDLPRPTLFLVHGAGELVSEEIGRFAAARSPSPSSLTGLAAADFDFADGLRVWSYDKADYTIRMDVETGMFEDVLLAAMLGGSGGFDSAGMNARGMNARGMNARGMNARGMNARGMNARGGGNSD